MAFCPNCGTKLPEGGRFCPGCGAAAGAVTPTPAAPVNPAPVKPVPPTPTAPVQPTYAPPVQPTPVTVTQPVKVKGKINWTVFIILMLVGLLIIGAGVAVVVDILDDGEFNLFGLLDSDSSDDDDEDDDDKKKDDKDDEDEDQRDDEDEDQRDNEDEDQRDNEDEDQRDDEDEDQKDDEDEHNPPAVTEKPSESTPPEPSYTPSVEWSYQPFENGELYLPGTFENGYDGSFYDSTTDTYVSVFLEDLDGFCDDIGIRPTQSANALILGIVDYFGTEDLLSQMYVTYDGNYVAVIQWEGSDTRAFYVYPMGDEVIVVRMDTTTDWDDYMYTWFDIVDGSDFG